MTIDEILHFNLNSILLLHGMNASSKQEAMVKTLTSAWEKKNSKVARAGGVSLMALSLAACGGSDDTPFSQVDIDSAVTAANAAAAAEAAAAATAAAASEAAAVAAAEATAAEAATAAATAAAASEAAAVAAAEATAAEAATAAATAAAAAEAAAVAAAEATATAAAEAAAAADIAAANAAKTTAESAAATAATAQAAAETAQAAAETAQATAEAARDVAVADKATAETAQAAAETAKVAAEAAKVAAENATAIAEAAKATAEASLATLQTTYDALLVTYNALANPAAVDTTVTLTSSIDNKSTTGGNDTYYALNAGDLATGDVISAGEGTDTVVATISDDATVRPVMTSVETVNVSISATSGADSSVLNLDQSTGVTSVNVNTHVSTDNSEDTFTFSGVGTAAVMTITDNLGAGNLDNNYTATYSSVSGTSDVATVNVATTTADLELGTITVAGVETLTVSASGGFDSTYTVAADAATTLTLNNAADSVSTDTDAGSVTVAAALVTTLNVNDAGSLTVSDGSSGLLAATTVNIDSQTAGRTVTMNDHVNTATAATADTVTYNVQGAGNATLENDTAWGTYNATTNADSVVVAATSATGDITYSTNASAANIVNTGAGDDTVIVAASKALDQYDTVNLGAGTNTLQTSIAAAATGATTSSAELFDTTATVDPTITGVTQVTYTLDGGASSNAAAGAIGINVADAEELVNTITIDDGVVFDMGAQTLTVTQLQSGSTLNLGKFDLTHTSSEIDLDLADATGTSDSLTVGLDIFESGTTDAGTVDLLDVTGIESVTINLSSSDTDVTTATISGVDAGDATSVTLTGGLITTATVDGAATHTVDATAITAATTLVASTDIQTLKGSSTDATTFTMAANLNNADTIEGGAATTDSLTATIDGLDATTGALNISGVETVALTGSSNASSLNLSSVTGMTTLALAGSVDQTITNLTSGTTIQLDDGASSATAFTGTLDVSLADSSSSSDALTVQLTGTGTGNSTLDGSNIETLNLSGADNAWTAGTVDVSAFEATSIVATGTDTSSPAALDLRGAGSAALNAATNSVNASGFDGVVLASAATNTATTFSTKVAGSTFTGSSVADTMTIGSTSNYVGAGNNTFAGGTGSDTLTIYAAGSATLGAVTAIETINVVASSTSTDYSSNALTVTTGGGTVDGGAISGSGGNVAYGINSAGAGGNLVVTGGLAGTTVTLGGDITDLGAITLNASGSAGSIVASFGDDALEQTNNADAISITGGAGATDVVHADMTGTNTGSFTMAGVETLHIHSSGTTATNTVNLTNVSGVTELILDDEGGTAEDVTITGYSGHSVTLGQDNGSGTDVDLDAVTVTLTQTDTSGTSDTANVTLEVTGATSGLTNAVTIAANGMETINLAVFDDEGASTGNDHNIAVTNTNSNAATINVTGADTNGDLTLSGVAASVTTIAAGSFAGDLVVNASARGSDAMTITGGTGADTIAMENVADVLTGGAGATISDEVQVTFSGTGGSIVVDLSSTTDQVTLFNGVANSVAQTGFEDIDVSGYTQTGSVGADITGSTGANVIVGTAYADTIRGGAGDDDIVVATAGAADSDVMDGGAGTGDKVTISTGTHDFTTNGNLINVETIVFGNGTSSLDLSAQTDGFSITTGTGADTIILGSGTNTINLTNDSAADVITFLASGNGTNTINGFTTAEDKLDFSAITFQASTVDGAKSGTIANFDTMAEIQATTKHGAVIITETDKDVTDLVTALNASGFDADADASAIYAIEDSTASLVKFYHVVNSDAVDNDDVAATLLFTSDIAAVSSTLASADFVLA